MTITVTRTEGGRTYQMGESTAEATRQAGIATGAAATATTKAGEASADADATAADRIATAADRAAVTPLAAQVSTDAGTVTTLAGQVANDKVATQNYMTQAQNIALGSVVDAKNNLVIGAGAVAPTDGADGSSVILGDHAGSGTSQTYTRKLHAIGLYAGANFRGYAAVAIGSYTADRAVSDYSAYVGTHSGQDSNATGIVVPGYGVRATGTITFAAVPNAGDTVTVNGVVFTAGTEFAVGATAAAAAKNLLVALLASTSAAVAQGYYRIDNAAAAVINVASSSRGTYGNAFTLAKAGANIAVSGATLAGGSNYANTGIPGQFAGDAALGFGPLGGSSRTQSRKAIITGTMGSLPADGSTFRLGFNLTKTITFRAAAPGALEVLIGATVAETLANIVAVLNGSADGTIAAVTYWARNGQLFFEHDSANTNTFECVSQTAALVFPQRRLWGGQSNLGGNAALGQAAAQTAIVSGATAFGLGAGQFATGTGGVYLGFAAGQYGNGNNRVAIGQNASAYCEGDGIIAIGDGINGSAQDAWLPVAGIAIDGIVTFASPHGWREGHDYPCYWRDRAASGATIQSSPTGTGTWTNTSSAFTGISLRAINDMQAQIIGTLPDPTAGGRVFDYRANGTVTNLDIARQYGNMPYAVGFGTNAVLAAGRITLGSAIHHDGVQVDAIGLNVAAGQFRMPSVIAGVWATGQIQFPSANGNFADGDTVTLNGTAFTAKTSANLAAANNAAIRWFAIGGSIWETLNNLLLCIRNSDDQSAAAKAVKRARFWLASTTGVGWRIHVQALDTGGNGYTLASSKAGAVVTAMAGGTVGNLPTATSNVPPKDKGMVMVTASPLRDGAPGPAIYDSTSDVWKLAA